MSQTTAIEIALGILATLGFVVSIFAVVRLRAVRRDLLLARGADDENSIVGAVAEQVRVVQGLSRDLEQVRKELAIAQRDVAAALRHVSVVRFDAFDDMGGRLSFSAAMLDDNGDGVLLTSIHGHTESRMYVKSVHERKADGRTSNEELEAIRTASPIGS